MTTYFNPPLRGFAETYVQVSSDEIGFVTVTEGDISLIGTKTINWLVDELFPRSYSKADLRDVIVGKRFHMGIEGSTYQSIRLSNPNWQDVENTLVDIGVQRKLRKRFPY